MFSLRLGVIKLHKTLNPIIYAMTWSAIEIS